MEAVIAGTFGGMAIGFAMGLMSAMASRDGIWPGVWAGLILAGGGIGAVLGTISALF